MAPPCSPTSARWGSKASSRSARCRPTAPVARPTGSRARTPHVRRCGERRRRIADDDAQLSSQHGWRIARATVLWSAGLIAGIIFGGLIGTTFLRSGGDSGFFGAIGGAALFACVRLWATERRGSLDG